MEDNSTIINQNLSNQSQKPHLNWLIFVFVLIFGIGVGVLGTMMFQKNNDKQTNLSSNLQNITTTSSTLPTTSPISPTSDPTKEWKTYTNSEYLYSFKYPDDMEVLVCKAELVFPVKIIRKYDPCNSGAGGFSIEVISADLASKLRSIYSKDYSIIEEMKIKIGGVDAIKFKLSKKTLESAPIPDKMTSILINHNNVWFIIDQVDGQDQILSTFKFINQSTNDETMEWKTYTNNVAKFIIRYPENWSAVSVAAGGNGSKALPNSIMIDISKTGKTEIYPEGVMSIQIFQAKPSYPSTFVKTTGIINNYAYEKYFTTTDQQLLSETYLFTSPDGKNFIEILMRYKVGDTYKEIFDKILSTFKFLN
jgi:hypothetical protein